MSEQTNKPQIDSQVQRTNEWLSDGESGRGLGEKRERIKNYKLVIK